MSLHLRVFFFFNNCNELTVALPFLSVVEDECKREDFNVERKFLEQG